MKSFFSWNRDNNALALLFLLCLLVVYFSPSVIITRIFFLLLLIPMYNSKKDYLWLAWLFILFDAPGYLFKGGEFADVQRIPIYPVIPTVSVSFFEIALFVLILKAFLKKRSLKRVRGNGYQNVYFFQSESVIFLLLLGLYVVITIIGFDHNLVNIYRIIIPWSYVFIIFYLMRRENDFINFFRLLFPFVFVTFFLLIFYLFEGVHFVNLLKTDFGIKENLERIIEEDTTSAARSLFFVFPSFVSLIASFYFLKQGESTFKKGYLFAIISFIFLNALLTATRGYLLTVMFIILVSGFRYFSGFNNLVKFSIIILLLVGIFSVIIEYNSNVRKQIELSLERNKTIMLVLEGDYTAGGTLGRLDYRIPKIKKEIAKSPIIGHGFSQDYFSNLDGDVGFFNIILNVGYLGLVVLYLIYISLLNKVYRLSKTRIFMQHNKNAGFVFVSGLVALQIYHFTTNVTYGLAPGAYSGLPERYFIYGLIIVHFNVLLNKAREAAINKEEIAINEH